jgi:Fe-S-cluster containining protein
MSHTFYDNGLHFSCTKCSGCCRHESGVVYLNAGDLTKLCRFVNLSQDDFIAAYCRWVQYANGSKALSLTEQRNYDCVFWDKGCTVYEARPVQCVTYPFWTSLLSSEDSWKNEAVYCPGVQAGLTGTGTLYTVQTIRQRLADYENSCPIQQRDDT